MLKILGHDSTTTESLSQSDALTWRDRPEARIWLDGWALSAAETDWLRDQWDILAVHLATAAAPVTGPHLDAYPDYIFGQLLLPDAQTLPEEPAGLTFCLGTHFLLTLHHGPLPPLTDLWTERAGQAARWRYGLDELLNRLFQGAGSAARDGANDLLARWRERSTLPAGRAVQTHHRELTEWVVAARQWTGIMAHLAAVSNELAGLDHPALDANIQHDLGRLTRQLTAQQRSLSAAATGAEALLPALRQRLNELNLALAVGSGLILLLLFAAIILSQIS